MTNREEFCALLYGTFYESISDSAIIRQQHEKIRTWVQSNIPSRLYRYRAVNDHTFDALRKDEIWGSSIFSFNDPFECMPHYDPERAKELLKREMDIGQIAEKYRAYKNGGRDLHNRQFLISSDTLMQKEDNLQCRQCRLYQSNRHIDCTLLCFEAAPQNPYYRVLPSIVQGNACSDPFFPQSVPATRNNHCLRFGCIAPQAADKAAALPTKMRRSAYWLAVFLSLAEFHWF